MSHYIKRAVDIKTSESLCNCVCYVGLSLNSEILRIPLVKAAIHVGDTEC